MSDALVDVLLTSVKIIHHRLLCNKMLLPVH